MVASMIRHAVNSSFKNGKLLPAPPSRDRASSASVAYQRNQGTKPPSRRFTSAVTAASNVVVTKLGLERRAAASSRRLAVGRECELSWH